MLVRFFIRRVQGFCFDCKDLVFLEMQCCYLSFMCGLYVFIFFLINRFYYYVAVWFWCENFFYFLGLCFVLLIVYGDVSLYFIRLLNNTCICMWLVSEYSRMVLNLCDYYSLGRQGKGYIIFFYVQFYQVSFLMILKLQF